MRQYRAPCRSRVALRNLPDSRPWPDKEKKRSSLCSCGRNQGKRKTRQKRRNGEHDRAVSMRPSRTKATRTARAAITSGMCSSPTHWRLCRRNRSNNSCISKYPFQNPKSHPGILQIWKDLKDLKQLEARGSRYGWNTGRPLWPGWESSHN
jgi:hypothetical protein